MCSIIIVLGGREGWREMILWMWIVHKVAVVLFIFIVIIIIAAIVAMKEERRREKK